MSRDRKVGPRVVVRAEYEANGKMVYEIIDGYDPRPWYRGCGEPTIIRYTASNGESRDYVDRTLIPVGETHTLFTLLIDGHLVQHSPEELLPSQPSGRVGGDPEDIFEPRPVHTRAEDVRGATLQDSDLDRVARSLLHAASSGAFSPPARVPYGRTVLSALDISFEDNPLVAQLADSRIALITTDYWYKDKSYPNPTGLFTTLKEGMWAIALFANDFKKGMGYAFAMRVVEQKLLKEIKALTDDETSLFFDTLLDIAQLQIDEASKDLCDGDDNPILETVEMKDGSVVTKPKLVLLTGCSSLERPGDKYVWGGDDLMLLADKIYSFARANREIITSAASTELNEANLEAVISESVLIAGDVGGEGGGGGAECKAADSLNQQEDTKITQPTSKNPTILDNFQEKKTEFELKLPPVRAIDLECEDNGVKQYREDEANVEADLAKNFAEIHINDCATDDIDGDFSVESMIYRPELLSAQFLAGAMLIGSLMINHDGGANHALGIYA